VRGEFRAAQVAPDGGDGGAAGGLGLLLPMLAVFLLMYALLIRPQQRQQKEHKKLLTQIQKGDQVVTSGGIHGRVTGVTDDVLTVEIAERVRIKLDRSAVVTRVPAPAEEKKG
jgi:preprotein translocase subunit YajC